MPHLDSSAVARRVGEAFRNAMELPAHGDPHLRAAVHHALEHPGSLVRAKLSFQMSQSYQLPEGIALPLAVGVEYFHTASLLLDDLPCMDDAAERRGVPCTHKLHGEATALLAALALINRAYGLLWQALENGTPSSRLAAASLIQDCLGVGGMLQGQSADLHSHPAVASIRNVLAVAMGKTVPLIRLTLILPALLAEAPPRQIRIWRHLAVWWGLGYQILDDLKDLHAAPGTTGKTMHRDPLLHRPNMALTEGTPRTICRVRRLLVLAAETLARLDAQDQRRWEFLLDMHRRFATELQSLILACPSIDAA